MEHRILIYAPIGKDARLVAQVFERAGLESAICAHATQIVPELDKGAGALFIVDEVLTADFLRSISDYLRRQQAWSDLPILVMSKRGLDSPAMRKIYQDLGNVTLLERPLQSVTLLSAANSALRARKRQYEMREADRRKDEFLAMLAHELRNPLAPVSAASELLRVADLDRERIKKTSEVISRQVKHMTGLIDDLLDVSRVSRGLVTLDIAPIDARQIVTNAVEQVRPLIDARRHRLTLHTSPESAFVEGDQKRLIQIVSNLLNNAAKYTPEGGSIVLSMDVTPDTVMFKVEDNGIGMTQDMIGHVFELFAQAERTSDRSQGGLGIGLALVKSLVGMHQGTVTADSRGKGIGSAFTVFLPRLLKAGDPRPNDAANAVNPQARRLRVLIVDDNVDAAQMLAMFLEACGHEISIVHDAKTAIEQSRFNVPDVFLLDIGLPEMDGNELAKRLRTQEETSRAVLIAVTGYGQDQDRIKTKAAGFNHHLVKPVDPSALAGLLANMTSASLL